MDDDIFVVRKVEHHRLGTCPCDACSAERERRDAKTPANNHIKRLSADAAFTLGLIPRRSLGGSVAKSMACRPPG